MTRGPRVKGKQKKVLAHTRTKAPNQPRKPKAIPLTDAERAGKAKDEHGRATLHMNEARRLAPWGQAPNACLHSINYAMYHAATAVLFLHGGIGPSRAVPESHTHVLGYFGQLAAKTGAEAEAAATLLANAKAAREEFDDGSIAGASPEEARAAFEDARQFIPICEQHLLLPPIVGDV